MRSLIKILPIATLLFMSALTMSAQNPPSPHNDNCWSSFGELRNCQFQAEKKAEDYAQRCTSYPEYQCVPEYISMQKQPTAKRTDHVATSSRMKNASSDVKPTQASAEQSN